MRVNVKKWGNSAFVRIPASVMAAARLRIGQTVEVREELGRVVIRPVTGIEPDLTSMIAAIAPENRHAEAGWYEQ